VEIYETEEEQLDAVKRWWKENGQSTIIGLVLGVAVILGWNYWQSHKKAQSEQASAIYSQLIQAIELSAYRNNIPRLNMQLIALFYWQN
jgi:predicted negative regulator of RcsB-dependent stress response